MDDRKMKRSSMLAYVPVHRREGGGDKRFSQDSKRYSQDSNGYRSSVDMKRGWRKTNNNSSSSGSMDGDDDDDINTARFSNSSFYYQQQQQQHHHHDDRHAEEWDDLLRQYDRTEDDATLARKNKRASRLMDPLQQQDTPTLVPLIEEPTVILDCYDFPKSFKTHHLHDIFREYENVRGGYRIKWMDDTRALIIFEHPATAKKAYIDNVNHGYARIRPYEGPTDFLAAPTAQSNRRSMTYDAKRHSGLIPVPLK